LRIIVNKKRITKVDSHTHKLGHTYMSQQAPLEEDISNEITLNAIKFEVESVQARERCFWSGSEVYSSARVAPLSVIACLICT